MASFLWYEIVTNSGLEQGDFFFSCRIPSFLPGTIAADEQEQVDIDLREYDIVIITQSCDLSTSKVENVLVCPVFPVSDAEQWGEHFRTPKGKDDIRKGNVPGLHMLAGCDLDNFTAPIRVVSFRQTFSLPFHQVRILAETTNPRLRLLPPYREHLAQAFARFIMRVGLPVDIPSFK